MEKILKSESMPAVSREWKENVFKIQGLDFPLLKPAQRGEVWEHGNTRFHYSLIFKS